jgi:GNAT superfamily N-acetyltransferase
MTSEAAALRHAVDAGDVMLARELFVEYAQWLNVDLCFQGFERELAALPGAYAPPRGRLLLAGPPRGAFACAALRPLEAAYGCSGSDGAHAAEATTIGEIKRLYVRPSHRHAGWGSRLAQMLIDDARTIGYLELKLDTLEWMVDARKLYAGLGFRECAAYYDNPLPGVVYMSLLL